MVEEIPKNDINILYRHDIDSNTSEILSKPMNEPGHNKFKVIIIQCIFLTRAKVWCNFNPMLGLFIDIRITELKL